MSNSVVKEKQLIISTLIDLMYAIDNRNSRQICSLLTPEARQDLVAGDQVSCKEFVNMLLNNIGQNITQNQLHQLLTLFIFLLENHAEFLYDSIFIQDKVATVVIEQYRIVFEKRNHFWFINEFIDDSDIYEDDSDIYKDNYDNEELEQENEEEINDYSSSQHQMATSQYSVWTPKKFNIPRPPTVEERQASFLKQQEEEKISAEQMKREQRRQENLQKIRNTSLRRYHPHQV